MWNSKRRERLQDKVDRRAALGIAAAGAVSLCCVLVLLGWSLTDASFPMATWALRNKCGFTTPDADDEIINNVLQWDLLGSRVAFLALLAFTGIMSLVVLFILVLKQPSLLRTIVLIVVIVTWVGLLLTRETVDHVRTTRQASAMLPRAKIAAEHLSKEWPSRPGEIPPGIHFYVDSERYPDVLIVRNSVKYPVSVDFGLLINRGRDGIIRFDLATAPEYSLEYHPNGTEPESYTSGFGYGGPPVAFAREISENWFVVRYGDVDK